jgi:prepilin-type processing-associated H-X9-DG protein
MIELLTVVAIVAVLMALILPAVQQAREAARRMSCASNLRQVGLALHQYEAVHRVFPPCEIGAAPGRSGACESDEIPVQDNPEDCTEYQCWVAMCLPHLGESVLANHYNNEAAWSDTVNRSVVSTRIELFVCPSAPGEGRIDMHHVVGAAATDYGAIERVERAVYTDLFGVPDPGVQARTSVLSEDFSNRVADIADGLSQSIMLVESAGRPYATVRGQQMNEQLFLNYNDDEIVSRNGRYVAKDGIGWADPESAFEVSGTQKDSLKSYGPQFINAINVGEAYSFHSGGAAALFADGSVHLLSENIDSWVFVSLCTRAGSEVVGEF